MLSGMKEGLPNTILRRRNMRHTAVRFRRVLVFFNVAHNGQCLGCLSFVLTRLG